MTNRYIRALWPLTPDRPHYGPAMVAARNARQRAARRRKRRMDRADNDLSAAQWEALKAAWGGCAYCGVSTGPLQRDCVQALSRGGRYTFDNVVPVCRSCNASKCNAEVTGWLRRRRLDEQEFLRRFLQINRALRQSDQEVSASR